MTSARCPRCGRPFHDAAVIAKHIVSCTLVTFATPWQEEPVAPSTFFCVACKASSPRAARCVCGAIGPDPARPWQARSAMNQRGQALVEFALVFPILCFAFLGMVETAFLFATQHGYQSEVDVVASWSAVRDHDDAAWHQLIANERDRTGCDGEPIVTWLDGDTSPGSRVAVTLTCHYTPVITTNIWPGGLDVSVNAEAVVPGTIATPAPSTSPAPSVDPSPSPS